MVMKRLSLLYLAVLTLAGCATSDSAKEHPNPVGVYRDTSNILPVAYFWEEFALRADGSGTNRMSMVIGKSKSKPKGEINEYFESKGTWRFQGDKIVYQDTNSRIDPVGDFFLALFNPEEPRSSLSSRHVFSIDSNGDLLRIPPKGHPYYAGRFVKQD